MKVSFKRRKKESRQAKPPGVANVFSYYASRSPSSKVTERYHDKKPAKQARSVNWHMFPVWLATVAILISLGYLLWLDINPRIEVVALTPEKESIMQSTGTYQRAGQEILSKSIFNRFKLTVDTNQLASNFQAQFPELSEVAVITPIAGHRLTFEIKPTKPAVALLSSATDFTVLDERGRALFKTENVNKITALNIPAVVDETGIEVEVGDSVLPAENVGFITELTRQLSAKDIPIQSVILPLVANEIHIKPANQSYYIKFNIVGDARLQAGSLVATLRHLEREGKTPSVYIDVRTGEKVYYQ